MPQTHPLNYNPYTVLVLLGDIATIALIPLLLQSRRHIHNNIPVKHPNLLITYVPVDVILLVLGDIEPNT